MTNIFFDLTTIWQGCIVKKDNIVHLIMENHIMTRTSSVVGRISRRRILERQKIPTPLSIEYWKAWFEKQLDTAQPGDPFLMIVNRIEGTRDAFPFDSNGELQEFLETDYYMGVLGQERFISVTAMNTFVFSSTSYARIKNFGASCFYGPGSFNLLIGTEHVYLDIFDHYEIDPMLVLPEGQKEDFWSSLEAEDYYGDAKQSYPPAFPVHVIVGHKEIQEFSAAYGKKMMYTYLQTAQMLGFAYPLHPKLAQYVSEQQERVFDELLSAWREFCRIRIDRKLFLRRSVGEDTTVDDAHFVSAIERNTDDDEVRLLKRAIEQAQLFGIDAVARTIKLASPGMYLDVPEFVKRIGNMFPKV